MQLEFDAKGNFQVEILHDFYNHLLFQPEIQNYVAISIGIPIGHAYEICLNISVSIYLQEVPLLFHCHLLYRQIGVCLVLQQQLKDIKK